MKRKNKKILLFLSAVIVIAAVAIGISILVGINDNIVKEKIDVEKAQEIIDSQFDSLPNNVASEAKFLRENTDIKVEKLDYGTEKDIILTCSYKTLDLYSAVGDNIDDILNIDIVNPDTGKTKNATKVQIEVAGKLRSYLEEAETKSGTIDIYLYEMKNGELKVYLDDAVINEVFGGIIDAKKLVGDTEQITVGDKTVDISSKTSIKNGLVQCFKLVNYDSSKPDVSIPIVKFFNDLKNDFHENFIVQNRWIYLVKGLGVTLGVTAVSLVLGIIIGFVVAIIRCTCAKTGKLEILDSICGLYITVMRGTPIMIQLMIMYFVVLLPMGVEKYVAAVLCFGINSGAYVAEIVRGGIMSVDNGQTEAGRSLGFNYVTTMYLIVVPQAIKAVLPALANEFIALLKETSVAFYIGVADLTMGGLKIRSITYNSFMPLLAIGLIYLVLVLILSYFVSLLERRMNKSDRS